MAKARVTAVFSSETYPLCSYFASFLPFFQGARGPDGPVGEPGSRGVKVSASGWAGWPTLSCVVKCSGQDQGHILLQEEQAMFNCFKRINQQG